MQGFMRWVQTQFYTLIMLMLAGGFAMLLAELLLTDHTDGIQLVAVVASVAGLVLILAGLLVRGRAAMVVAALLLVLSVTGLVGTVEHLESREGEEGERAGVQRVNATNYQQVSLRQDDEENEQGEAEGEAGEAGESEETPPPLAPLSLAGLSLMGALSVVGGGKRGA